MKTIIKLLLLIVAATFSFFTSCKKEDAALQPVTKETTQLNSQEQIDASLVNKTGMAVKWYQLAVTLVRNTPNHGWTPISTRDFAYIGLSLYESVVPGLSKYKSIQSQLNGLPALPQPEAGVHYNYAIAANASLARMVHHMFGNTTDAQKATIDSLESDFNASLKSMVSLDVFKRSQAFGRDIANAIYKWSKTDGGHEGYLNAFPTTYVPPKGPGLWVPLPGQIANLPYAGNNRTFIAGIAYSTQPPPPPDYSTNPNSIFYQQEWEIYNESINQDPEHAIIARYWAAIPPSCVSITILTSILTGRDVNFGRAAEAFCKLGIAISDAAVSCYRTKYFYNQERPTTFIRDNFNSNWASLLPTPPFPDYTSAHSVQTGASARILASVFGNNTTFTDESINDLGFTPRTFNKFSDYANEVGLSRIYGGIHNRAADFKGLKQGDMVGEGVLKLKFLKN